jgi:hypothetical protein
VTSIMVIILITRITVAQSPDTKREVLDHIVSIPIRNDFSIVAAKIHQGVDTANAYKQLDTLLSRAYGDMFWMYGCAGLYYATSDVLRPEYKARIRQCWKHCTPYRGDTENHFLMYYGSLFLMAQAWPDMPDTEWFMGKSSKEIYDESKEYLDHWIDETVRNGQEEWDSPRYGYYYITPLALLAEYAKDKRMKHRFEMMLEYELASYAADYLSGSYCGAHSRVSDECAIDPHSAEIETYGNYFFGNDGGESRLDTLSALHPDIAFAAMTSFKCPDIIRHIATDREKPYEQFSFKRGRQMLRYLDKWSSTDSTHDSEHHAPVYKYDYMTKDYCLGSIQGGIVQPIQQQSWSLTFNSDKHHNIITGLNPYVSEEELGMFFPEYPSFQLERISSVKKGYTNENKWEGGSPYEHIYQDKNWLEVFYNLPDSVKHSHVDLFISDSARILWQEQIILDDPPRHGYFGDSIHHYAAPHWTVLQFDSTLIGIKSMGRFESIKIPFGTRWRMPDHGSGYIIYCSSMRDHTLQDVITEVKQTDWDHQSAVTEKMRSRPQERDWLFHSPYLESKKDSGILTMRYKGAERVLDFN